MRLSVNDNSVQRWQHLPIKKVKSHWENFYRNDTNIFTFVNLGALNWISHLSSHRQRNEQNSNGKTHFLTNRLNKIQWSGSFGRIGCARLICQIKCLTWPVKFRSFLQSFFLSHACFFAGSSSFLFENRPFGFRIHSRVSILDYRSFKRSDSLVMIQWML